MYQWYLGYCMPILLLDQHGCFCCLSSTGILRKWYEISFQSRRIKDIFGMRVYSHSCKIDITLFFLISGAIAITGYNERLKPVHIYDIYCSGNEKSILECPHNAISNPQSCSSYYRIDASVQCQGTIHLLVML